MKRFWSKVEKTDDCWIWTGAVEPNGYGRMWLEGRTVWVHRFAYELLVGPIDGDLTVDHICRNRRCVNPDHLRLLTRAENGRLNGWSAKTHCPRGHAYDEANTYHRPKGGRGCRACRRVAVARYQRGRA